MILFALFTAVAFKLKFHTSRNLAQAATEQTDVAASIVHRCYSCQIAGILIARTACSESPNANLIVDIEPPIFSPCVPI